MRDYINYDEIPAKLLEINRALEPYGAKLSAEYGANITQHGDKVKVHSVSINIYFIKKDD